MNYLENKRSVYSPRYHLSRNLSTNKENNQKREIYLVDDDQDDLYLSSKALSKSSRVKDIHQISNAMMLFGIMKDNGVFNDEILFSESKPIIMLDIHMPNFNGIETLEFIKSHPMISDLTVILLSSDLSADKAHEAYNLQVDGYLEKPCELSEFHIILDNVDLGQGGLKSSDYSVH